MKKKVRVKIRLKQIKYNCQNYNTLFKIWKPNINKKIVKLRK